MQSRVSVVLEGMGMNINLTPQLKNGAKSYIGTLYVSASEVVREALRLMEEKDQVRAAKLEQLRNDIQEGVNNSPATAWDAKDIKRIGQVKGRVLHQSLHIGVNARRLQAPVCPGRSD